jgi:hypothetical protein
MRLIDADVLLKKADWFEYYDEDGHWDGFERIDVDDVEKAPTVDAVEVVRCKDCRFYEENAESRTRFCRRGLNYQYAVPDGFCSYGERRTNDKRTDSTDRA